MRRTGLLAGLGLLTAACGPQTDQVGEFKNDWIGNEIKVEALHDPEIPGVLCHFAHFDRAFWDRMAKGNWFEDPSNTSISCLRVGPIDIADVRDGESGEEVFSQRHSLFFKNVAVRRIFDAENNVLVYVSHSREIVEGSAKMSISTVALEPEDLGPESFGAETLAAAP
jgi:CreA protein